LLAAFKTYKKLAPIAIRPLLSHESQMKTITAGRNTEASALCRWINIGETMVRLDFYLGEARVRLGETSWFRILNSKARFFLPSV